MPESLYEATMKFLHDHPTSGHFGTTRTIKKTREACWWPHMDEYIVRYIRSCDHCQRFKSANQKTGYLTSITPSSPGKIWAADLAILPS